MSNKTPVTLRGIATSRGCAVGPAFAYRSGGEVAVSEFAIPQESVEREIVRFRHAVANTKRDISELISELKARTGKVDIEIFECHLMMIEDPLFESKVISAIRDGRINAEAAVRKAIESVRESFARMNDAYFRERVRDLDDVERRLLLMLTGSEGIVGAEFDVPSVIIADNLTPSETVQLPSDKVLAFVTESGSSTSHVALLARAMDIPAVTGISDLKNLVSPGDEVLVDGDEGVVIVNPDAETKVEYFKRSGHRKRLEVRSPDAGKAGFLKDGVDIPLLVNLYPGAPTDGVKAAGARGIGLFRSEYLWMDIGRQPSEEEQFAAYRKAAEFASTLGPHSAVTIRVLDIGGDKLMDGVSDSEANPFLGNRSIRYLLSNRDVFERQLRAILRASAYGRVKMMYPMVSCIDELDECEKVLNSAKSGLKTENIPFDESMAVGAMIEIPAAALNAEAFAKRVDFFSIGTNDLVQYTMAADRGNKAVANLYQPLNPSVLKLMAMTFDAAKKADIPVSVCGESASDPVMGVLWVSMGASALSMSAAYIPMMAKLLQGMSRDDMMGLADIALQNSDCRADEIHAALRAYMQSKLPALSEVFA